MFARNRDIHCQRADWSRYNYYYYTVNNATNFKSKRLTNRRHCIKVTEIPMNDYTFIGMGIISVTRKSVA